MPRLNLGAKVSLDGLAFEAGIRKIGTTASRVGASVGGQLKSGVSSLIGGAIGAAAIKSVIDYGAHIADLSGRLGISAESLQEFEYASKQVGVEIDSVAKFFEKLNGSRLKALRGNEDFIKSFAKLGVTIGDLRKKRVEDIAKQIGLKLRDGDPQKIVGDLREVGGKSAGSVIPVLAGFEDLSKEARTFGGILSDDVIENLDDAHDSVEKLVFLFRGPMAEAVGLIAQAVTYILAGFKNTITAVSTFVGAVAGGAGFGEAAGAANDAAAADAEAFIATQEADKKRRKERKEIRAKRGLEDFSSKDDADIEKTGTLGRANIALAEKEFNLILKKASAQERINLLKKKEAAIHNEIVKSNDPIEIARLQSEQIDIQSSLFDATKSKPTFQANALQRIGAFAPTLDSTGELKKANITLREINIGIKRLEGAENNTTDMFA